MSTNDHSCAGNGAASFTTSELDGLQAGDTITVEWTTRPGCEKQTVAVAGYSTEHLQFDPVEDQPLIGASAPVALGTHGSLSWVIPDGVAPRCQVQVDVVTGPVLAQVDTGHRYNKPGFGLAGGNDLVAAAYAADPSCGQEPTTTAPPVTVIVEDPLPPADTTSTTAAPVPPATATTVVDPDSPVASPPPATGESTPYALCLTSTGAPCPDGLPVTGGSAWELAGLGAIVLGAGLLALTVSRRFRRAES